MEALNKKYNIEIEVLTPLSVGAGAEKDWVKGADFVVKDGCLYKLNLKKMAVKGVDMSLLTSYFSNKNSNAIIKLLGDKLEIVSDFCIKMPADSNDIKAFIKNQLSNKPVLPGSSLKGAIRSVLYQYLGGKSKDGKEVFGSSTDGDEFMRFIKISDAEFERTTLVNTKIFNLQNQGSWKGGWKHGSSNTDSQFKPTGFNTIYESLVPHQLSYASLMMSEKLYDNYEKNKKGHIKTDKKRPVLHDTISTIFGIINKHTKDYLQKEKAFFQKYSTDKTENIIANIDNLLYKIPEDNSYCIMKMSAGSGFHSITGDWQFEDYTSAPLDRKRVEGKVNPKSRKIAIYGDTLSLMGFVKLRNISDAEYTEIENQRAAKKKDEVLRLQREIETEKQQREAEEKERKEREVRNALFYDLLKSIKELVDEEKYEEAWTNLQNAKNSYPECKQIIVDEEYLKSRFEMIQSDRQLQERQQQAEQAHRQAQQEKAEGGLAKLLEEKYDFGPNEGKFKVTSFKVCSNKVESWLKAAGVSKVPSEQQSAFLETLKRLKGNPDKKELRNWHALDSNIWKKVAQFVGPELAKEWFKEVSK